MRLATLEVVVKNIGALRPAMLAAGLLAFIACRDSEAPTSPELVPALATASTALSFDQVSAGSRHTCGVTAEHRAYCWGWNFYGQLGNGESTDPGSGTIAPDRHAPVPVLTDLRFRQVSAGTYHTCGVTTDFQAYCWGSNADGSLGDGTTTDRVTPVPVAGGHQFRLVDAGDAHTCGVSYPDNLAYCWGVNSRGAIGDGVLTLGKRLTPSAVAGGRQFRQVAAGLDHTCGVTTTNRAFCWGSDSVGQLGDSNSATLYSFAPVAVAGSRRFRQVDAGAAFTCAVTTTERAFCWGSGREGQIGDGRTFLRFWPRAVAGGHSFERVTTGYTHTCGEATDNRAYCWGHGALGDGTTTQRLTPTLVAGGHFFSQVSAGGSEFGSHTCGKTGAGVAFCWGWNEYGQVGDGTTTSRLKPRAVVGPE
jgi:alpha-tubulin suppressor-like RCC1 family protein